MEHLISMYATLQTNPVKVSYPKNQPSIDSEKSVIKDFKWDHDFITFYHFGPYELKHVEIERRYNQLCKQKFSFSGPNIYPAQFLLHYNNDLIQLNDFQKEILHLGEAVINKSHGKKFENPFVNQIQYSAWNLEKYITESPNDLISNQDKEYMIAQLNALKVRLLKSQNALEK